jgi:beta-N-acetylhexosaminidase
MKFHSLLAILPAIVFFSCEQKPADTTTVTVETTEIQETQMPLNLGNYYDNNPLISRKVDSVYETLNDTQRVGQMIVTSVGKLGKPDSEVLSLVREKKVGAVMYLNKTMDQHRSYTAELNQAVQETGGLPLIISMDAEPSLINYRTKKETDIANQNELETPQQVRQAVTKINNILKDLGVNQNYSPVVDMGQDNEIVGNRSFPGDEAQVVKLAKAFVNASQADNIVATIKHFPGHGRVTGDTHKQSVYLDGKLEELPVYEELIDNRSIISVMVAHITIRGGGEYDTDGMPSTLSRNIVTGLLREKMNFQGIIATDALDIMKAVTVIPQAPLKASKAGNDMLLMPIKERVTINNILNEMKKDADYAKQVEASVKRILRLKVCMGLI